MPLEASGLTPLLEVYDMPRSIRFYRDMLGFEIVSTSPPLGGPDRFHWVWLRLGGAEIMLNTAYEFDEERPTVEHAERIRGHGDLGLFIGCPDVDGAYRELVAKGLTLNKPHVAPYGMKQLSFRDPDGYGITLQWRADVTEK
ncbi:MAG: VOC family protein [Acidobacteriaceae bacterium]|nr:VOC family protein [Acidobacteriaceae bacterium]